MQNSKLEFGIHDAMIPIATFTRMTQSPNWRMFRRLWFRALTVKRPQAMLAGVSLLVGAATISMLLNLYSDVRRKLTEEFSAYGANVVLAPHSASPSVNPT